MNNQVNDPEIEISSEASASVHEDGIVILDARRGRLFRSNLAGMFIWRCLEQHQSFEAIADRIHTEFQIARATAREHTGRFLAELERHCLIARRAEA